MCHTSDPRDDHEAPLDQTDLDQGLGCSKSVLLCLYSCIEAVERVEHPMWGRSTYDRWATSPLLLCGTSRELPCWV
jgi:hypothetical protein